MMLRENPASQKLHPHLLLVTSNENKFAEVAYALSPEIILHLDSLDFVEDESHPIEQIAKEKAKQGFLHFKQPLLVEDTGIFFEGLNGYPGVRAKRVFEEIGLEGLLEKLVGKNREAYFETVICYSDGRVTEVFSGKLHGTIADSIAPAHERKKFPYERIFIPDGFSKVMSHLSISEKSGLSHRAKAARAFKKWFLGHTK